MKNNSNKDDFSLKKLISQWTAEGVNYFTIQSRIFRIRHPKYFRTPEARAKQKISRNKNKVKIAIGQKRWKKENKKRYDEYQKVYQKAYAKKNRKKLNKYANEYNLKKRN